MFYVASFILNMMPCILYLISYILHLISNILQLAHPLASLYKQYVLIERGVTIPIYLASGSLHQSLYVYTEYAKTLREGWASPSLLIWR